MGISRLPCCCPNGSSPTGQDAALDGGGSGKDEELVYNLRCEGYDGGSLTPESPMGMSATMDQGPSDHSQLVHPGMDSVFPGVDLS